MKGDDISERLLDFGVRVLKAADALPRRLGGKHIAMQLIRSGTAAGAVYEEARGAESRADFVHKLGVSWKEVRESTYWLRLIRRSALIKPTRIIGLLQEAIDLSAILGKSVKTTKRGSSRD